MFYQNEVYQNGLEKAANIKNICNLKDKTIMITGANGMIGSAVAELCIYLNDKYHLNMKIYAACRNAENGRRRFNSLTDREDFKITACDVTQRINIAEEADYIVDAAGNSNPAAYAADPVGTMLGNFLGVYHLLEYAKERKAKRLLYISSGEVYGEGADDVKSFTEEYSGYVDCTKVRSCYPSSKRASENLCVSYSEQYGIETVIVRPCHIFGPTAAGNDNRAATEFLRNVANGRDIVMKSEGRQVRTYCYILDCAAAVVFSMINGENMQAYNIANQEMQISIKELAQTIARAGNKKVTLELPDEIEKKGYTPISRGCLNTGKLEELGWKCCFDLEEGIRDTIRILSAG